MAQWKIRQIFDGDYGCEERLPGQGPKVSVTPGTAVRQGIYRKRVSEHDKQSEKYKIKHSKNTK